MKRQLVLLTDACGERPWATPRYLRRLVATRKIPFHKIAGRVWFDVADLDAYAEAGRQEPFTSRAVFNGRRPTRVRSHSS